MEKGEPMAKKYIDTDNIKFDISGLVYIEPNDYKGIAFYFLKQLDEMPSADVVEVVRCRDCKYAHLTYSGDCKQCDMWVDDDDLQLTLYLDGDFYCSYGERRTDEP